MYFSFLNLLIRMRNPIVLGDLNFSCERPLGQITAYLDQIGLANQTTGSLNVAHGPLPIYYLIQASTSYENNLCFSKSSEKLPEMTKKFLDKNH